MRFFVVSINDQSLIIGRNDDVSIPVGTVFTWIGKMQQTDKLSIASTDLGFIEPITLTLIAVHWYGREIDHVPRGHTAGLAVTGGGIELLGDQLSTLDDGESLYLAAT